MSKAQSLWSFPPTRPGCRTRHRIPVSDDYEGESVFTGTVNWVQIDLGEDAEDADHLITPEERLRVAMAASSQRMTFPSWPGRVSQTRESDVEPGRVFRSQRVALTTAAATTSLLTRKSPKSNPAATPSAP